MARTSSIGFALGRFTAAIGLMLAATALHVSGQVAPPNGMRPADPRAHAITNATVITAPGSKLENATIIIRDGLIQQVGPTDQVTIPPDARVWPGEGLTVYPGLIESALLIRPENAQRGSGSHWNARINPEIAMVDQPAPDAAMRKDFRSLGFTAAAVYPSSGAIRGTGVVLALADENEHVRSYRDRTAMMMALDFGGGGGGGPRRPPGTTPPNEDGPPRERSYPGSLMGAIALIRQTLYDAQWHAACQKVWREHPTSNEPPLRADALEALGPVLDSQNRQTVLFDVNDELNALRAVKLAGEFNLDLMLLGSGYEFRRLNEIIAAKAPVIVPLEFPKRPDVSTQSAADSVALRDLMTWEQAPTNARRLINAAPPQSIALTTYRLKSRNEFHSNLRSAIKHGLTEDQALAALTTTPAKLLKLDHVMGTIEPGKVANLVVVKGSLFDKEGKIHDTWVNGRRYEIFKEADIQLKGSGRLRLREDKELPIEIDTTKSTITVTLPGEEKKKLSAKKVIVQQDQVSFVLDGQALDADGYVQLSGVMEGSPPNPPKSISGTGALPDGSTFEFTIEIDEQPASAPSTQPATQPEGEKGEGASDDVPPQGDRPARDQTDATDPVTGTWTIRFEQAPPDMSVVMNLRLERGTAVAGNVEVMGQTIDIQGGTFDPSAGKLTMSFNSPHAGQAQVEATIATDSISGKVASTGFNSDFSGTRAGAGAAASSGQSGGRGRGKGAEEDAPFIAPPEELNYPLGEYGLTEAPKPQNIMIINATIWTCGPQGILHNASMMVVDGKIQGINPRGSIGLSSTDSLTIDAQGKHITPGLIDCHSHTGISGGVNEGTQANTAEVRISDCIDPDDIDWYRELAGGLTACNQLHGSANPIGGQNSVVKIKWGHQASDFPIAGAIQGIKFALGENVKRSTNRYPNTRMGVETFIRDNFTAAREYKAAGERYKKLPRDQQAKTMPPRRDLELDALVEILDHQRIVHCHSYRQDEILMLIRLADSFGFTIGTFQHVLEGYKVADAIAKHGAGASSFSDWWAYKVEVMDAIPYNGSLMDNVGVLVSFNSDSDELARRMNTEAAKAVRYGGLSPEEALKFVTINPAKQLRVDNRIGSLEAGKDADFVIWSGDPLSTYTRCEQTWIEGAKYFDIEDDLKHRETIARERNRIVQKILTQTHGKPGKKDEPKDASTQPSTSPDVAHTQPQTQTQSQPHLHLTAQLRDWLNEQVRLGFDPTEIRPGDCGCGEFWSHCHD
jgi:imidazolonepropionase-like amidohydrolase